MEPALSRLSPKRRDMHLPRMEISTGIQPGRAIAVLSRTPATLNALLRGLPNMWVRGDEGKDTWSAFDIMGHLIVGERTDWMPRLRIILENGEARPFDPFDRFAQFERESRQVAGAALGRFRPPAKRESGCAAGTEFAARRLDAARKASSAGSGDAVGTSGDMGRSRPHSCASTIPRDGPPVSGRSRSVERLSGRAAVCWS